MCATQNKKTTKNFRRLEVQDNLKQKIVCFIQYIQQPSNHFLVGVFFIRIHGRCFISGLDTPSEKHFLTKSILSKNINSMQGVFLANQDSIQPRHKF